MYKRLAIALGLAFSLLAAKDEGFNGKWVIDKGASTASADIPDNLTQQIKKKGDGYQIETFWKEPKNGVAPLLLVGVMITQLKLTTDGQEVKNQVGPFMQASRTTLNGDQMVTDWTAVVNGQAVKGKWTRTLTEDGKGMTLDIEESTADGKNNSGKLVFKRK